MDTLVNLSFRWVHVRIWSEGSFSPSVTLDYSPAVSKYTWSGLKALLAASFSQMIRLWLLDLIQVQLDCVKGKYVFEAYEESKGQDQPAHPVWSLPTAYRINILYRMYWLRANTLLTVFTLRFGTDRSEQTVDPDQMTQNATKCGIWSGSTLSAVFF